jgi:hypothetical protein
MKDEEKPESTEPKLTEEERLRQVRERIRNSKTFINKTQPGKGTAIIGGVRRSYVGRDMGPLPTSSFRSAALPWGFDGRPWDDFSVARRHRNRSQ